MKLLIASKTMVATDIVSFELVRGDGKSLPPFSAGAHIDVVPCSGIIRQYSLLNNPAETHRYRIAVLLEPNSRGGSKAMHGLSVGQSLEISAPKNHFPLADDAEHSILLAGGIGITPVLSMAEHLTQRGASFELHYCVKNEARAAFIERLRDADLGSRANIYIDTVSDDRRINLDHILSEPSEGKHLYVCGPGGFIEAALNKATRLNWCDSNQHREFFRGSVQSVGGAFRIELAKSGRIVEVEANETVLAALSRSGVEIPTSCEQGVCGTCLTTVLSGKPEHLDSYLTDDEKSANNQFLPCCSRSLSPVLVVDL